VANAWTPSVLDRARSGESGSSAKVLYEFHDERLIEQAQRRLVPGQVSYIPEVSQRSGSGNGKGLFADRAEAKHFTAASKRVGLRSRASAGVNRDNAQQYWATVKEEIKRLAATARAQQKQPHGGLSGAAQAEQ
jgi:hypothetical protein